MLTRADRLHFELSGFVLLKNVLTEDERQWIAEIAGAMKKDSTFPRYDSSGQTVLFGPAWYDRRILALAMDARLRAKAEDIVGGATCLEENEFLIFSTPPDTSGSPTTSADRRRWHRGLTPDYGSFESGGHYHCLFTKAIVYLSPKGPMTGTWVVPGSHKSNIAISEFNQVVDETMTRYVDGEPGDVLLFGETLIHSSPPPGAQERVLLVIAYSAPFMKTWNTDTDPPQRLPYGLTDEERRFVFGERRYDFREGFRD